MISYALASRNRNTSHLNRKLISSPPRKKKSRVEGKTPSTGTPKTFIIQFLRRKCAQKHTIK